MGELCERRRCDAANFPAWVVLRDRCDHSRGKKGVERNCLELSGLALEPVPQHVVEISGGLHEPEYHDSTSGGSKEWWADKGRKGKKGGREEAGRAGAKEGRSEGMRERVVVKRCLKIEGGVHRKGDWRNRSGREGKRAERRRMGEGGSCDSWSFRMLENAEFLHRSPIR